MAHLHVQALVQACNLHGGRLGARRRQVHHVAVALSVGGEAKLLLPDLDCLPTPCSLRARLLLNSTGSSSERGVVYWFMPRLNKTRLLHLTLLASASLPASLPRKAGTKQH